MTSNLIKQVLTDAKIPAIRKWFMARQKYRCPICKGALTIGKPALDHDHNTGHCRGTLCQSCNVSEGKVKAGMAFRTTTTNLARRDPVQWLRNLADYLEKTTANPSGYIHPTFDLKTGKQRPIKRKVK